MYRNYFINKLILGTAQLSSNYGIANKTGKMRHGDLRKIKKSSYSKRNGNSRNCASLWTFRKDIGQN